MVSSTGSAQDRKARSEALLRTLQVPINPGLPQIESDEEASIRDPGAVAARALVLYEVIAVGHGLPGQDAIRYLQRHNLWDAVSPREKAFLNDPAPSEQATRDATWRLESLWVLLWALNYVETLDPPTELCDVPRLQSIMDGERRTPDEFIRSARLRSRREILDASDLIYRIHWAVTEARIHGQGPPAGLNPDVVPERHYVLNWLTVYADGWDDITTDT